MTDIAIGDEEEYCSVPVKTRKARGTPTAAPNACAAHATWL